MLSAEVSEIDADVATMVSEVSSGREILCFR